MDPLVVVTVGFVVALVVGIICVKKCRMDCCWTRLDLSSGEDKLTVDVLMAANKSDVKKKKKNTNSKVKVDDRVFRRQTIMFNEEVPDPNIELKEKMVNGKEKTYIQKKWKTMRDTSLARVFKRIYHYISFRTYFFLVWELALIMLTASMPIKLAASVRTGLQTYIVAFVGIFSVLLSLLFSNGVEKNKENKRLFQALCGDIKAMGMWLGALTNNKNKYECKRNNDTTFAVIQARDTFEVEVEKIRLLLSVLAPVAKHVLRDAKGKDAPTYDLLDDKVRLEIDIPKDNLAGTLERWLIKWGILPAHHEIDTSETWYQLSKKVEENPNTEDVNRIKVYLYKKIKKVADASYMDLFEVVMYCLLDSVNNLNELGGDYLGEAKYSKERDLIVKWQHIYGSWGTMSSITTYRQPTLVHVTIFVCLALYTIATTVINRDLTYVNFTVGDGGDPDSYYDDWTSSVDVPGDIDISWTSDWFYFHYYVVIKSVFQVLPFTWLFFISNNIGKPFKKGFPDASLISEEARLTQQQVSSLMSNRAQLDAWDMTQDYGPLKRTLFRESFKNRQGIIYPVQRNGEEKQDPDQAKINKEIAENRNITKTARQSLSQLKLRELTRKAGKKEDGNDKIKIPIQEIKKRTVVRFKNVNF